MSLMTDIGTAVKGKLDLVNTKIDTHLSMPTSYHLLEGEVSVSNGVITSGFGTTLYTGNGTTQAVNTGIDMDTQWGNDASEKFGGLVWIKNRDTAAYNNLLFDSIRGATNYVITNSINAQANSVAMLTSFVVDGFGLGNYTEVNGSSKTYASWNFQTTHRRTGVTNHGKAFTEHYNPFTGFTIIKYEGSGISGHEIPHSLGRKLGFWNIKDITSGTYNWATGYKENSQLKINLVDAEAALTSGVISLSDKTTVLGNSIAYNTAGNAHIMYGWANSYFDESNKLIGNYEIGVYQGTGAAGNKVTTKGKPAWIMQKRIDNIGNWNIMDIQRANSDGVLRANTSDVEASANVLDIVSDGFVLQDTSIYVNASGGQYLYMVVYDNDNGSGKSKYPKATDSSQLQINALIPFANGIDGNGAKNTILSKNETITGLTYTQGKNYVYGKNDGTYGVSLVAPKYNIVSTTGDYFDTNKNKWFNSSGVEIALSRNYLDAIVYADHNGQVEYVESLPKTQYVDEMKANEFKGKNACTAWVNFDGTTTPPTIRDSYNVSAVVKTGAGIYDVYFEKPMDNINYGIFGTGYSPGDYYTRSIMRKAGTTPLLNKVTITHSTGNAGIAMDSAYIDLYIMGGRN